MGKHVSWTGSVKERFPHEQINKADLDKQDAENRARTLQDAHDKGQTTLTELDKQEAAYAKNLKTSGYGTDEANRLVQGYHQDNLGKRKRAQDAITAYDTQHGAALKFGSDEADLKRQKEQVVADIASKEELINKQTEYARVLQQQIEAAQKTLARGDQEFGEIARSAHQTWQAGQPRDALRNAARGERGPQTNIDANDVANNARILESQLRSGGAGAASQAAIDAIHASISRMQGYLSNPNVSPAEHNDIAGLLQRMEALERAFSQMLQRRQAAMGESFN